MVLGCCRLLWIRYESNSDKRSKLVEIIKTLLKDKKVGRGWLLIVGTCTPSDLECHAGGLCAQIDRRLAFETFEQDCMQAVALITDVEFWKKKEIRFFTKTYYTQNKYVLSPARLAQHVPARMLQTLPCWPGTEITNNRHTLLAQGTTCCGRTARGMPS